MAARTYSLATSIQANLAARVIGGGDVPFDMPAIDVSFPTWDELDPLLQAAIDAEMTVRGFAVLPLAKFEVE